ncbi:MAG: UbiD family decarboxylase [Phycisphaerales bacterium]|nr:UbiD family decarboxylase [Phycisphaerales bacterium]
MYRNLGDFVRALEAAGELARINAPVDPVLEIPWAADRASKSRAPHAGHASSLHNDPRFAHLGGKALLFERPTGSQFPLLINAWGSYRRMEMALGATAGFDGVGARIGALVKPEPPRSLRELCAKAHQFAPLLRIPPRRRRGSGPCQDVVLTGDRVDLTTLPIMRCWPHDGDFASLGYPAGVNDAIPGLPRDATWNEKFRGRYITLAGIHTIHADDINESRPSSHNIGMYRVQLFGPRTMSMHWHIHHDGARHWRSWKSLGKPMPVAIALGGESVLPYAATAPLPPGISELLLAGFLHGRGIEMVRAATVPLWVPANAEIIIEGFVSHESGNIGFDPRSGQPLGPGAVFEGPFGDHTGFYSLPDRYPLLNVTAITHCRNAIYPTTVVGLPPQEDYFLGKATERVFFPLLKTLIHDIEDYDLPLFGAFHNCACIQIKKAYPLQGRRVMHSVWGAGQMAWTKTIFVVDADVDVHNTFAVLSAAWAHCDPLRDLERVNGPLDILDHAAPRLGAGTKIGFDCTRKFEDDAIDGRPLLPARAPMSDDQRDLTQRAVASAASAAGLHAEISIPAALAGGWLFIRVQKAAPGDGARAIAILDQALAGLAVAPGFVIVVGQDVDVKDIDSVLFHWCAHTDAGRDLYTLNRCVAFDATPKVPGDERNGQPVRSWPPILRTTPEIAKRVSERAAEFGIAPSR